MKTTDVFENADLNQPLDYLGVDRGARVIRGIVAAEVGPFKSGRGSFDLAAVEKIVQLINDNERGHVCYLGHPTSGNDVDRPYLGVFRNARLDGTKVRVDLHFSGVAMKPQPNTKTDRSWGEYVMELAEEDSRALGFSLRPRFRKVNRNNSIVWDVHSLRGGDVVREGDATNSFLSTDSTGTGTPEPSNTDCPEPENSMTISREEMLSAIQDGCSKVVADLNIGKQIADAIADHDKKKEELAATVKLENENEDLKKKVKEMELSQQRAKEASLYSTKAGKVLSEDDLAANVKKINDGELSYGDACSQLMDVVLENGGLSMDEGGGNGGNPSSSKKAEKQLQQEHDIVSEMGLELSFDEYKDALSAGKDDELVSEMIDLVPGS